ncbi:hypothetical protein F2Q68_00033360 [Brassica cretica]|uniref:Uncharacterized protein n=2 Tax=Brassica cretica TaxID=69181 RepID=A0ABQ7EGW5_BRACR|nr:hypothetical protein F2Q68_00033360 [Brassica cretica]KAF3596101.1 hypothetical protein DY000_02020062 [Brassica cretica]
MDSPSRLLALVLSFVSVMGRDVQIWMLLLPMVARVWIVKFVAPYRCFLRSGFLACGVYLVLMVVQCRCWEQDRLQYVHGSTLVLRGSEGDRFTGCVNKTFPGKLYRLRRGVMVRMRRVESTLKVQWRDLVGIEGLSRCSSHIVLMVDEFYFGKLVSERKVEHSSPEVLFYSSASRLRVFVSF